MLYPVLTVAVGVVIVLMAITSLTRAIKDAGPIGNQLRFLAFGVVLIGHFPLTQMLEKFLLTRLASASAIPENAGLAYWGAIVLVVCFQLAILPTTHEIFTAKAFGRLQSRAPEKY